MQSNRPGLDMKWAFYATIFISTILRLMFGGFMFMAAVDSKTLAISYGLIVVSAVVIVFAIRKLINILQILRRVARISIEEEQ